MTEREKEYYWLGYHTALCSKKDRSMTEQMKIQTIVCEYYGVSMNDLKKANRKQKIRFPRQVLSYLLHTKTTLGCVGVAKIVQQDHSSVLNSVKQIRNMLSYDLDVQTDIKALEQRLVNVMEITPIEKVVEKKEPPVIFTWSRPKAEYSNRGYLNLVKQYSEVV